MSRLLSTVAVIEPLAAEGQHLVLAVDAQKPRSTGDMTWAFASAPEGIRTPNLLIRSQMLYPLSYRRWNVGEFSLRPLWARNRLRWRLWA